MMKRKNTKRWAMHPMVSVALKGLVAFVVCIIFGVALAYAVIYFMAWLCCC